MNSARRLAGCEILQGQADTLSLCAEFDELLQGGKVTPSVCLGQLLPDALTFHAVAWFSRGGSIREDIPQ